MGKGKGDDYSWFTVIATWLIVIAAVVAIVSKS